MPGNDARNAAVAAAGRFQERFPLAQHLIPTSEGKTRDSQLMRKVRVQTRGKTKQKQEPVVTLEETSPDVQVCLGLAGGFVF